ncbi:MAG: hypothetical protein K2I88_05910 [Anaeroplasmataceae bacterium]|nr:hypothetical protein [Anaeroplasmataceae bacterium]
MFCKKCGANIPDDEDICPFCEEPVEGRHKIQDEKKEEKEENLFPDTNVYEKKERKIEEPVFSNIKNTEPVDHGSIGYGVLGFFFPLIGFILFCIWRTEKPTASKQCGIGALIGFVLGIFLSGSLLCCVLSVNWDAIIKDPDIYDYAKGFQF